MVSDSPKAGCCLRLAAPQLLALAAAVALAVLAIALMSDLPKRGERLPSAREFSLAPKPAPAIPPLLMQLRAR